jgi:hypothetical protein
MTNMQEKQAQPDDWRPCPPGALQDLATGLRTRKRRRVALQWGGIATLLLLSAGTGALLARLHGGRPDDLYFGGISCTDVRAGLPELMRHSLPAERERQMLQHLRECPHCQEKLREMGVSLSASPGDRRPAAEQATHVGPPTRGAPLASWFGNSAQ